MLKYWIRDENSTIGQNIFGNVFEIDVPEVEQTQFEKDYPAAELVGDDLPLNEKAQSELRMAQSGGTTVYGPAFPFGSEA